MTHAPNIEQARKRFVSRIAYAYFQTWISFGFTGPEFSYERAQKIAQDLANEAFPAPQPLILSEDMIDPEWLKEGLAGVLQMLPPVKMSGAHSVEPRYAF